MLLTIRTTHQPATDLGFLLHIHPGHVHTREFPFGNATVFYTEASEERSQLHRSLRGLGCEGFRHVHVLKSQEEVDAAVIERQPLWNNRKRETGPFDIIGDVHALHIAVAVVMGMDYVLTWNCTHIANAVIRPKIEDACRQLGYDPPVICTPEELME
jgi:hypothetical protein